MTVSPSRKSWTKIRSVERDFQTTLQTDCKEQKLAAQKCHVVGLFLGRHGPVLLHPSSSLTLRSRSGFPRSFRAFACLRTPLFLSAAVEVSALIVEHDICGLPLLSQCLTLDSPLLHASSSAPAVSLAFICILSSFSSPRSSPSQPPCPSQCRPSAMVASPP